MASITGRKTLSALDLYTATTDVPSPYTIGEMRDGNNGKIFRYAKAGASALVKGNLLQEAANDTQFENMAVGVAGAVGDRFLQITNGTTTVTSEAFIGGSINVYTAGTVAIADEYTITSVGGVLTTGGALIVYLDRPLRYAFSTSAKVNMKRSPWSGVIQFPATTPTGMAVGVAIFEIPANQYGWVQTHGTVSALSDGSTFAVGSEVGTVSGTAGAVTVATVGTTKQRVGVTRQIAASAKGITIFLQID